MNAIPGWVIQIVILVVLAVLIVWVLTQLGFSF